MADTSSGNNVVLMSNERSNMGPIEDDGDFEVLEDGVVGGPISESVIMAQEFATHFNWDEE